MALVIAKPGKAQVDWKVCRTPADPFFFFLDEKGVGWGQPNVYSERIKMNEGKPFTLNAFLSKINLHLAFALSLKLAW